MSESVTEVEQNPSANTAEGQNSVVPLGWKPHKDRPVPVVRCTTIKRDGTRCKRWSLRGTTVCYTHGGRGNFDNVEKYRQAVVESARLRLVDESEGAIDALVWMMDAGSGTADAIRLKAATEVLDRAGIRGGFEVDVEVSDNTDPAAAIRERLGKLQAGAKAVTEMRAEREAEDMEVLEAEVVEDTEQLTLFETEDEA